MPYNDPEKQKEYLVNHYRTNKEKYNKSRLTAKQKRHEYVQRLKTENPCVDCGGYFHFSQMQYDHTDASSKVANVNQLLRSASLERIQAEIDKCELVCANCHAYRTWSRHQDLR